MDLLGVGNEATTGKSPHYPPHVFDGNLWLEARQKKPEKISHVGQYVTTLLTTLETDFLASFPHGSATRAWGWTAAESSAAPTCLRQPSATSTAWAWAWRTCSTTRWRYCTTQTTGRPTRGRFGWSGPRIPLPGWPDGNIAGTAEELAASAERGRELALLLDSETSVPGVTTGGLRPELAAIGVPATAGGRNMDGDDFSVAAGWGHFGSGDAVMPGPGPGRGTAVHRRGTRCPGRCGRNPGRHHLRHPPERRSLLAQRPANVWNYKLGGYQVLKKWLSYREGKVLGRNLHPEEVQHFTDTAGG